MESNGMDLRRLSHVVALADTLHFARAAEAVHLSQPAFSRSIQVIEGDLGIRLLECDIGDPADRGAAGRPVCAGRPSAGRARSPAAGSLGVRSRSTDAAESLKAGNRGAAGPA